MYRGDRRHCLAVLPPQRHRVPWIQKLAKDGLAINSPVPKMLHWPSSSTTTTPNSGAMLGLHSRAKNLRTAPVQVGIGSFQSLDMPARPSKRTRFRRNRLSVSSKLYFCRSTLTSTTSKWTMKGRIISLEWARFHDRDNVFNAQQLEPMRMYSTWRQHYGTR